MQRDQMITTRCNGTEKRALQLLAELERRTPSETIRELVREAAHERGCWPAGQATSPADTAPWVRGWPPLTQI